MMRERSPKSTTRDLDKKRSSKKNPAPHFDSIETGNALGKQYKIKGKLWLWNFEKGSWHFFTIPTEIAEEIYFEQKLANFGQRRGFGSVKCKVTIGKTLFTTSIFPNSSDKTYVLPIKKEVRIKENLNIDDEFELELYV